MTHPIATATVDTFGAPKLSGLDAGACDEDGVATCVAALVPVTGEAKRALGYKQDIGITHFPFKIGRESRLSNPATKPPGIELRLGVAPQVNDVYLMEPPWKDLLHISREHFAIEREGDQFFVVDRGSVCGTIVGGTPIGGNRAGGRTELRDGDLIIVGTSSSDYVFRFEVAAIAPEDPR